jgi:hypothetical protein
VVVISLRPRNREMPSQAPHRVNIHAPGTRD